MALAAGVCPKRPPARRPTPLCPADVLDRKHHVLVPHFSLPVDEMAFHAGNGAACRPPAFDETILRTVEARHPNSSDLSPFGPDPDAEMGGGRGRRHP